ncbi:Gfo/Idh/MocA family protein [Paenarthrobacter sp. NPDC089714]|uniref:Gfo/Idh/MocA family protein n=1 Tax=Paenarthrobacter sp. NPDC089714 TaxID=3364377 RepID=UPI0037FBC06F
MKIGFLGAGPGVAALHLPTVRRLGEGFRVAHIADGGSGRAQALAEPVGARWSSGDHELLTDPCVDAVAICTPPSEHERQILAAVAAGKHAIFCEKPLAVTREAAAAVVSACREAGVILLVGTNHAHDPGWAQAREVLKQHGRPLQSIAVTLALPPNRRYHQVVYDGGPFPSPSRGRPNTGDPAVAAGIVQQLLTGLAIHDFPAIRHFAPVLEHIQYARFVPPIGYAVGFKASGVSVQLVLTMLPEGPDSLWRMTFSTADLRLDLDYPPPFVHAGSGAVTVHNGDGSVARFPQSLQDGYEAEWQLFGELMAGTCPVDYGQILADALYPIDVADAVFNTMFTEAQPSTGVHP